MPVKYSVEVLFQKTQGSGPRVTSRRRTAAGVQEVHLFGLCISLFGSQCRETYHRRLQGFKNTTSHFIDIASRMIGVTVINPDYERNSQNEPWRQNEVTTCMLHRYHGYPT